MKLKRSELEALALAVLHDRRIQLAGDILAGKGNLLQRAEELAGLLLTPEPAEDQEVDLL